MFRITYPPEGSLASVRNSMIKDQGVQGSYESDGMRLTGRTLISVQAVELHVKKVFPKKADSVSSSNAQEGMSGCVARFSSICTVPSIVIA